MAEPVAEPAPDLVASFFTLSGGGFTDPPRNTFIERCEAAAAAGFSGIGLHADDLPRTRSAGVDVGEMQAVLRVNGLDLVEIEFLAGWALDPGENGGVAAESRRHRRGRRGVRRPACQRRGIPRRHRPRLRGTARRRGGGPAGERRPAGPPRAAGRGGGLSLVGHRGHRHRHRPDRPLGRAQRRPDDRRLALLQHRRQARAARRPARGRDRRRPTERRPAGVRRLPAPRPGANGSSRARANWTSSG